MGDDIERVIEDPERARILRVRHRARTDLMFLCREILGMRDVVREVHGPILDTVQSFEHCQGDDRILPNGRPWYKTIDPEPSVAIPPGYRRRLILDPRSFLKTSINVEAHTIQWLLNFPDVAILIMHASEDKAKDILGNISEQFISNKRLRYYFPEYCPTAKQLKDFGNSEEFTTPARERPRKEPSVSIASVTKRTASSHYHVIKISDIVEETNATTEDFRTKVFRKFGLCFNLLIDPHHWLDVEGTIYHLSDLYMTIMKKEWFGKEDGERTWKFHVRPVYRKVGVETEFTPDKLAEPYLWHDADGNVVDEKAPGARRVSWWPTWRNGLPKFDWAVLEEMRNLDPFNFAAQMLLNPIEASDEQTFPLDKLRWVPAEVEKRIPADFYLISIDTASTQTRRSNFSVVTTCKWTRNGTQIMVDCARGKWLPDELVERVFQQIVKWRPLAVHIEKTDFVRGLWPSVDRKSNELGVWPNWIALPPDNQKSKEERIENTLRGPFIKGLLRFSTGLPEEIKDALQQELAGFPYLGMDDILDTLTDQYQERDDFSGKPRINATIERAMDESMQRFLGQEAFKEFVGATVDAGDAGDDWVI